MTQPVSNGSRWCCFCCPCNKPDEQPDVQKPLNPKKDESPDVRHLSVQTMTTEDAPASHTYFSFGYHSDEEKNEQ